jgi:F-type H+-transporting ATPase subunit epsilon
MAVETLPTEIHLEIVTPDRQVVRDKVVAVSVPGKEGYMGILPGHAPLLSLLKVGELSYTQGNVTHFLAVNWGFVEVLPDRVIVLAETAERAGEIDVERAKQAKQRAEDRLSKLLNTDIEMGRARMALERAMTRLEVAERNRT